MTPLQFAKNEYKDWRIYQELERIETKPQFKAILRELVAHEEDDFAFWKALAPEHRYQVNAFALFGARFMRRVLGLTFTARFLERKEHEAITQYTAYMKTASPEVREAVTKIIEHEKRHEKEMIAQIREEKVAFMGNIILGLNDGLIELTGALTGFAFAFSEYKTVVLTGLITGIAASLSMASSAYMQARHEEGRDAKKSALYTGAAYLIVVCILVAPFVFASSAFIALAWMGVSVLLIICGISYYTAIIFERNFRAQLGEMLLFSVGTAFVTFLIGSLLRQTIGEGAF